MKRLSGAVIAASLWWRFVLLSERWGTLPHEATRPMPGDGLVPAPAFSATRAVEIHATPEDVYPWFAQMGPGRAGWYSYDWIDNRGVASAHEIHPEWVIAEAGASMGGMAGLEFGVVEAEPGRALVLTVSSRSSMSFTMSYLLSAWGTSGTRVVVRVRGASSRGRLANALIRLLLGPGDFVMVRRQLLGVKERAERR